MKVLWAKMLKIATCFPRNVTWKTRGNCMENTCFPRGKHVISRGIYLIFFSVFSSDNLIYKLKNIVNIYHKAGFNQIIESLIFFQEVPIYFFIIPQP